MRAPQADDDEDDEEQPAARSTRAITPAGARALQAELEHLVRVERPKVTGEVAHAASLGDRSENAEYIYGKKRLRELDRRIRFITRKLDSAVIVEAEARTPGVVYFGATVEVADEDGKRSRYLVVGPDEADPSRGRLSFRSPLGQALMKRRVGDVVTVRRPAGEIDVEILAISYD